MVAGILRNDSVLYWLNPAWHQLGIVLDANELLDGTAAAHRAGLGWDVGKEPLTLIDGTTLPDYWLTVRSDIPTGADRYLGVVKGPYECVPNMELAAVVDVVCRTSGAWVETCGTLWNGRVVWYLVHLPTKYQPVNGQPHTNYLLITSSHDGSYGIRIRYVDDRVVCHNTLSAALDGGVDCWYLNDTAGVHGRLDEVKQVLAGVEEYQREHAERLNRLASIRVSKAFVAAYLLALIPDPTPTAVNPNPNPARARNARAEITRLFEGDQAGGWDDGVAGTAYGLYCAFTQYTEKRAPRSTKFTADQLTARRFASTMMGGTADHRRELGYRLIVRATGVDGQKPLVELEQIQTDGDGNGATKAVVDSILGQLNLQE